MQTCNMEMIETADFRIIWECSKCGHQHKASENIETKLRKCKGCRAVVKEFISLYDENGEYLDA